MNYSTTMEKRICDDSIFLRFLKTLFKLKIINALEESNFRDWSYNNILMNCNESK